jgi:hypothetical protein
MGGPFVGLAAAPVVNLGGDVAVAQQLLDLADILTAIERESSGGCM